mgnify:CR=1 FL=1
MLQCINILKYHALLPENERFWGLGILAVLYGTAIFSPREKEFFIKEQCDVSENPQD